MTIKEVCEKYGLSQDTLRYYERMGVIPKVGRSAGGIRQYDEDAIGWIKHAVCMRNAGMPVERLVEYTKLCKQGDGTFAERRKLLMEVRDEIHVKLKNYEDALEKLDYKIAKYDEALQTGKLVWDAEDCE